MSHFVIPVFYIIYQSFNKETVCELNFERTINTTQFTDEMTFYHVIRWQIKNAIVQLSQRLQLLSVVVTHFLHVTWCNHAITWQINRNAYQNRRVPLLHFTRPDPIPTGNVIFNYIILINEELQITTFKALNSKDKNNT